MGAVNRRICFNNSSFQTDFSCKLCIFFSLSHYFHFSFSSFNVFKLNKIQYSGNTVQKTSSQYTCFIPMQQDEFFKALALRLTLFSLKDRTHFSGYRIIHCWVVLKILQNPAPCFLLSLLPTNCYYYEGHKSSVCEVTKNFCHCLTATDSSFLR